MIIELIFTFFLGNQEESYLRLPSNKTRNKYYCKNAENNFDF